MKVLLVNPAQRFLYENTKIKTGAIYSPVLSLATVAGPLVKEGVDVEIIDLNLEEGGKLFSKIKDMDVKYVGITFTTPLYTEAKTLARELKKTRPDIVLICGGVHATSMPSDVLKESDFDIAVIGEADHTLADIIKNLDNLFKIDGICFKKGNEIITTKPRGYVEDLDRLPYPAWELYDVKRYRSTALLTENNPVGWFETSRGCIFQCVYCNKNIFGRKFRVKSPKRVVDEMEYMLKCGFNEVHIADDGFTTDMKRAEQICDEIMRRGIKVSWATIAGIRVDRVNPVLLKKMKQAGCYLVCYGIESGNEEVLRIINKGITLKQVREAVRWSKEAGLEVFGYFMLGLPGDTKKSMEDTIRLAVELDLDIAKASITVPLPTTPLFEDLERKGRIKTHDWAKYNLYLPAKEIYDHPLEDWETIEKYYSRFYRKFFFRVSYILKTLIRVLKKRKLCTYIKYFLETDW